VDFILTVEAWPIWIAIALMAAAAGVHLLIDVVPNGLVICSVAAGLVAATLASTGRLPARGGIGSALACLAASAVILFALHASGRAPGGTAKMHIAYCTWLGCAAPLGSALLTTMIVTVAVVSACALGVALALRSRRIEMHGNVELEREPSRSEVSMQLAASATAVLGTVLADWTGVL
jgi:hypothetical protein